MKLKVAIIGAGVVGGALIYYLKEKTEHEVIIKDPGKGLDDDLSDADIAFVSVPVPSKSFEQDLSILSSAVSSVPDGTPIVVRSTILPGTCRALEKKFKRSISHIPEFLTERRANMDMLKAEVLYLGLGDYALHASVLKLVKDVFPDKSILPIEAKEAEMIKYAHNVFGACKVTYWNIISDLCKKEKISYEIVRNAALNVTGFINPEHTFVPGPDGKKGFAGTCFPVNVENFIGYTRGKNGLAAKFFEDVYCLNRIFRGIKHIDGSK